MTMQHTSFFIFIHHSVNRQEITNITRMDYDKKSITVMIIIILYNNYSKVNVCT